LAQEVLVLAQAVPKTRMHPCAEGDLRLDIQIEFEEAVFGGERN
jgi:hypothetical protein